MRPVIIAPRPLLGVCFTLVEDHEEQQDDGHPPGTRWATMINTINATSSVTLTAGTSSTPSGAPIVIVAGTFYAAHPQPEVGASVSNDMIKDQKDISKIKTWIPPNARLRRRPL